MSSSLLIAVVSNVLVIGCMIWQWRIWRRDTRSKVVLRLSEASRADAALTVTHVRGRPAHIESFGFELPHAPRQGSMNNEPMVYQLRGDGGSFDPFGATYPPLTIPRGESWTTFINRSVLEDHLGRPPTVRAYVFLAGEQTAVTSRPTKLWNKEQDPSRTAGAWAFIRGRISDGARRIAPERQPREDTAAEAMRTARRSPPPIRGPQIRSACEAALDRVFDWRGMYCDPIAPVPSTPSVTFGIVEVSLRELSFGMDPQIAFVIVGRDELGDQPLEEVEWEALAGKARRGRTDTLVITERRPAFALEDVPGTEGRLKFRVGTEGPRQLVTCDYVVHWSPILGSNHRMLRWLYDRVYTAAVTDARQIRGDWI